MSNMNFRCTSKNSQDIVRKMMRRALCLACLAAMFVLIGASSASAQLTGKGAITGTVMDGTGAVVAGASISATNSASGITATTVSTGAGDYNLADLDPGIYVLTVTATGF